MIACARWISELVLMPKKSLRIRESQKPDANSMLKLPNGRDSGTNSSVGGSCTWIAGGWYVNGGGSNRSGGGSPPRWVKSAAEPPLIVRVKSSSVERT